MDNKFNVGDRVIICSPYNTNDPRITKMIADKAVGIIKAVRGDKFEINIHAYFEGYGDGWFFNSSILQHAPEEDHITNTLSYTQSNSVLTLDKTIMPSHGTISTCDNHEVVTSSALGKSFRYCRDCKKEVE